MLLYLLSCLVFFVVGYSLGLWDRRRRRRRVERMSNTLHLNALENALGRTVTCVGTRSPRRERYGVLARCEKHGTFRDASVEPCWQCERERVA